MWDGRDQEGDEVANGYYFYKIIAQVGEKNVTAIQRLTRVR
jgi:flagellar hook assembly protein FlgD